MEEKELSFEEALNRLNEITNTIQRPDCSLDDGFKLFEEGLKLCKFCNAKLQGYQEKLDQLTGQLEKDHE